MNIKKEYLEFSMPLIKMALQEDLKTGDITTETIFPLTEFCSAKLIAKEDGIICGLNVVKNVFEHLEGNEINWAPKIVDGDSVKIGQNLVELSAAYHTILSGERTALNFLQRMSGVSTKTKMFVDQLEGTSTKLLDTRKTIPGFRYLDKYSVLTGGGENHRFGLYDMVMIKENHIRVAGSITKAVNQIKSKFNKQYKIEVETTNLEEVKEAINSKVDIIMLDNMSIEDMKECVEYIDGKIYSEASGNINVSNIREVALTGVNYISVGSITHSVNGLDISLLIQ
jgi:nicotinate-nucleotide pyrophosphorylase (carboxylating)